jgi:molecular chaperone GrpE
MADKKNRARSAEVDIEHADDADDLKPERVYDAGAEADGEPAVDAVGEDAASEPAAGEGEPEPDVDAGADDTAPARGKQPGKFSRREILDRFQQKNIAITRLTKEKAALEKEKTALLAGKGALETQANEFKDKWLRSVAEFENYRKRSAKEWELLKQQSKTEVILEVLNSLDDFERAFAVVGDQADSEFVRGIRLIYNNLLQVLQKFGVVEIDALHQPFDPNRHMAIGQVETTEVASGHVVEVAEKGYAINGVVIRPARVIVAK